MKGEGSARENGDIPHAPEEGGERETLGEGRRQD